MKSEPVTEAELIQSADDDSALLPLRPLSYLFFPFFLVMFVGALLIFDPLQRLAYCFGVAAQQRVVRVLNVFLALPLRLIGTQVITNWKTKVDPTKSYIILSNHQSLFDLPLLDTTFPELQPRYVSKIELGKWLPSVSFNLRNGGSALIDRSNPRQAIPAIKELGHRMAEQNFSVVIFPEGTRARRGKLKMFHAGGINALLDAHPGAHILPVALDGSWQLSARKRGPLPVGVKVNISILPEIPRGEKNAKELVNEAHDLIEAELLRLRAV